MIRKWFARTFVAAFLLGTASFAGAEWLGPAGLPGGAPFEDTCGSAYFSGFTVRAGDLIDAIRGTCSNGNSTPWRGGTGGDIIQLNCANALVQGIQGFSDSYVTSMQVECRATNGNTTFSPFVGGIGFNYYNLRCPNSKRVRRIKGGAGIFLDEIFVYCSSL